MKAIIFGINGQDGYYLTKILKRENIEIIGVSRSKSNWLIGDVGDAAFVTQLIEIHKPDFIFHLAANSTTNHDFLFEHHQTIGGGTLNILEAVKKYSPASKVFLSGSALQFRNVGKPISEKDEFCANDAYSVARIHSVYAARYFRQLGIKVYVGYFFNHDSPLRSARHVNQKIIYAAKHITAGIEGKIELGNIDVQKEFTFAGDVVDAIWKFVNNDNIFEVVIGSGKAYRIADWLNIIFDYYKLDWTKYIEINENFKSEYEILVSDPSSIMQLGWSPKTDINELAKIMLDAAN